MTYQFIFGESQIGFPIIKSNDNGLYSENLTIKNALLFAFEKTEIDSNNISPMIFINNIDNVPVTIIGKASFINDNPANIIYHFYIFDNKEREELLRDFGKIFSIKKFVKNFEEAETFDISDKNIFGEKLNVNLVEIMKFYSLNKNMLENIIIAFFDCIDSDRDIYFINKKSTDKTISFNQSLLYFLFSIIPTEILSSLGFITYFKYIFPPIEKVLNTNIKIRFIENNAINNNSISQAESDGDYIFDFQNRYFTENKIHSNNKLAKFITSATREERDKLYFFFKDSISYFSKVNLPFLDELYSFYNHFYLNADLEKQTLEILLLNNNLFSDSFKDSFNIFINNNFDNLKKQFKVESDYLDYLLDLYEKLPEQREKIIYFLSNELSKPKSENNFNVINILDNQNLPLGFTVNLQKSLFSNKEYFSGGEIFFKDYLERIIENTDKLNSNDQILVLSNFFYQIIDISEDFFSYSDLKNYSDIINNFILNKDLSVFETYFKELSDVISILKTKNCEINFKNLLLNTSMEYLKTTINNSIDTKEKVKNFYLVSDVFAYNDFILNDQLYKNIYYNFFNNQFKNPVKDYLLNELLYYLQETEKFVINNNTFFMREVLDEILERTFADPDSLNDQNMSFISNWSEKDLEKIKNDEFKTKIASYSSLKNLDKYMEEKDLKSIKTLLSTDFEEKGYYGVREELSEKAGNWLESKPKIKKSKMDYSLLPYIYRLSLEKIISHLPKNNIKPWVETLSTLKNIDDNNIYTDDLNLNISNYMLKNKGLYSKWKKLPQEEKDLFGDTLNLKHLENMKSKKIGFFKSLFVYLLVIVISYAVLIMLNLNLNFTSVFFTVAFNIIVTNIILIVVFVLGFSAKKLKSSFITLILLISAIVITFNTFIYIFEKENTKNYYLDLFREVNFIQNVVDKEK